MTKAKVSFSNAQTLAIRKVKQGKHRDELHLLASKWDIPYHSLYNKWVYEGRKKQILAVHTGSVETDDVEPMQFVIDTTMLSPKRYDNEEITSMKRGLDAIIPQLKPLGGNICIKTTLVATAKRYLTDRFPENKFSSSIVKDIKGKPTGTTRIFKRK